MLDKRGRGCDALRLDGVAPRRIAARAEAIAWNHCPGVPRISKADRQADHWSAVVAEWAPTDIARCRSPRYPRRTVRTSRDPEPAAARVSPAAVMMRRPCPALVADPRPTVRWIRRPVAVIVRPPVGRNRGWIPDVAVAGLVLPRPVLIERRSVGLQIRRQILGGRRARIDGLCGVMFDGAGQHAHARRRKEFHFGVRIDRDFRAVGEHHVNTPAGKSPHAIALHDWHVDDGRFRVWTRTASIGG